MVPLTLLHLDSSYRQVQAGSGDAVPRHPITQRQGYTFCLWVSTCTPHICSTQSALGGVLLQWLSSKITWSGMRFAHLFMRVSLVWLPRDSVWALWKVKEMDFNPQLSVQPGKTL